MRRKELREKKMLKAKGTKSRMRGKKRNKHEKDTDEFISNEFTVSHVTRLN